jgi:hypothetical protein
MTSKMIVSRLGVAATAGALLALGNPAWSAGGKWDSAVPVPGSAGAGSGASSASPWVETPAAGSVLAEWNFFDSYPTDASPDIAGAGSVTEGSGMAFITGGGNIYSFAAPTSFEVTTAALAGPGEVWLRIATLGTVANTSATLNGVAAIAQETYAGSSGSSFGGAEKEWLWKWTLGDTVATGFLFAFAASGSSMSLDQLAVYAAPRAPIPEPSSVALLVAGLGLIGARLRRRTATAGPR